MTATPGAAPLPLPITTSNSKWLLFTGSHTARHQQDLVHFHLCLKAAGWKDQDIIHFTEPVANSGRTEYGALGTTVSIHDTVNLLAEINRLPPTEVLIVVLSGHGAADGVVYDGDRSRLKGAVLVDALKARPGIKTSVVVNGVCFAGGMNYLDAKTTLEMCIVGATSLNFSYSFGCQPKVKYSPFQGNLFLFYFAQWIANKVDVDGDNVMSVLDAYKWAASKTTDHLVTFKAAGHRLKTKALEDEADKLDRIQKQEKQFDDDVKNLTDSIAKLTAQGHTPASHPYLAKKVSKLLSNLIRFN